MANEPKSWLKYIFFTNGDSSVGINGQEFNLEIVGIETPDEDTEDLRKAIHNVIEDWCGEKAYSMTHEEMKSSIESENAYYEELLKKEVEIESEIKQNQEDLQQAVLERRKLSGEDFTEGLD